MTSFNQHNYQTRINSKRLLGVFAGFTFLAVGQLTAANRDDRRTDAILPIPTVTATTVPSNGDGNPYGVAFVPEGFPGGSAASPGDILVSNFNNSGNLQGTGTTIVRIPAAGKPPAPASVFFQGPQGLGLTTALGVLREGFVIVGNMPAPQGVCSGVQPGFLLLLDRHGNMLAQWTDTLLLNGPWDLALHEDGEKAQLFVANVLSGAVTRIDLLVSKSGVFMQRKTQIASGYSHRCDPAALVVGPTGLVYDAKEDVLYVASTEDNAIYAVWDARHTTADHGTGPVIYQDATHLHGPLGMAQAPNGDLVVSNSDVINPDPNQTSELVEFTKSGDFVGELSLDPAPGGSFGLAFSNRENDVIRLAAVDDNANNITIWSLRLP
jgi:hypothetical protein